MTDHPPQTVAIGGPHEMEAHLVSGELTLEWINRSYAYGYSDEVVYLDITTEDAITLRCLLDSFISKGKEESQ